MSILPTPLSPSNEYFYQAIQKGIDRKDRSIFDAILLACKQMRDANDVQKVFNFLFQVLPDFNLEELRKFQEIYLPLLLQRGTPSQQQDIALQLAQWYLAHANANDDFEQSCLQAMHYFAKAIQIATIHQKQSVKEMHLHAQEVFMRLIKYYLIKDDAFMKRLDSIRFCATSVVENITQIDRLESFCFSDEDHATKLLLYFQATKILSKLTHEKYNPCIQQVAQGIGKPFSLPARCSIEKYSDECISFRNTFASLGTSKPQTPNTIRAFQKNIIQAFKSFFQILLDDAFTILGTSPCTYDIRAMGSIGREEICPYSDLEFMILIQDPKAFAYFKALVHILEIQIASLGETSTGNPVFTCIHTKNPSGFHIDSSPTLHTNLIQTPAGMARMQNNPIKDPQTIENTVLKTISISQTDPSLFAIYQTALEAPLKAYCEERAFQFFRIRIADYKKHWKHHFNPETGIFNIKEHYVEILIHLLSDIAFFFGITKTNTLDIIDRLVEIKVFTNVSGELVRESVATIYTIRIRLHTLYKEQKEEGSCRSHPRYKQLLPFEIAVLEKYYWLILRPLYARLEMIPTTTDFKTTFQKIDLIQSAFKQNFSSQTLTKPFIIHLASHLCQINAPLEIHLDYFRALSELSAEHPRQVYLEVLEKKQAILPLQRLLYVPNRSGLRSIFLKDYEWVKQGLTAITDPFDTQVPGQTVVCIAAPHFIKSRYLKPSLIQRIMDGENIKSEYTSAHSVSSLNDQGYHFHLKQKPSHPLMEYAIHNLSSRIAGKLTPSVELVRFEVHSNGRKKSYPVLISETIPGINLKNAKGPYNPAQYTWMLLLAILTRPGDGRLSNYIVGDNGMLYCVDNDISFAEPVIKEYGMRTVYFCSALFCLTKLDTPLDVETLKEFSCLEGDSIFHAWIEDIIAKEQKYKSLFSKEEIDSLYTEDAKNTFTPTILFKKGTLATLSLQFWQLQNKVAYFLAEGKVMTVGDLLKELISLEEEAIGTFVYKAYNNAKATPEEKLQQATDRKQEHSITSIQSHQVCLGKVPTLQEIMTKQRYSPQKAKEEFFSTLLQGNSLHARIKSSQGKIVMEANFKELKQERRRQALILKALSEQFKMMRQKPTILILHHSNLLTGDILAPFLHNQSERLDLRYCEKIDNNDFSIIQKQCPNLKELSLAGCVGITNISGSFFNPKLTFPSLESLDVSYCTNLHTLKLETPLLGNLKGRNNPLLKQVELITWTAKIDFTESLEINLNHRSLAFGKQQWEDYFGDIGIEPPLPQDIHQILNSPCPFWSGKRVCDTHLFVLVPATVNGKPLTLDSLQKLIANPKKGYKTQYWFYSVSVKKELGPKSTSSHWVLMTKDVIPGSCNKSYEGQKELIATHAKKSGWCYELPMALDAAVCILMEHVQTGTRLYSDNPLTFTRCQEKANLNLWPVVIGGFATGGLRVEDNRWDGYVYNGVGACQKFWTMVFGTWTEEWVMVFGDKTGRL